MKHNQQTLVPAYRNVMLSTGKPANNTDVNGTHKLFNDYSVDYPVSGDETLKGYGYIGIRQRHINIWNRVALLGVFDDMEELEK